VSITRFAPSPTGYLHLGHAYSAWFAMESAGEGGQFRLRIEDLETERVRESFVDAIYADLAWLGIQWQGEVWRQTARTEVYRQALDRLIEGGDVYPCFCSRQAIEREIARSAGAPQGELGAIYPGTCRNVDSIARQRQMARGEPHVWRLDLQAALARSGPLAWRDRLAGSFVVDPTVGDPVVGRRDGSASYHLAVVVDDAAQGIDLVTRGRDLIPATGIHRLLQARLGLPAPEYAHHDLVVDEYRHRLAKRDDARAIREYRAQGWTSAQVRTAAEGARSSMKPV